MQILQAPPPSKPSKISYGQIARLSLPIMIGSAVQNIVTLMDSIFLGRVGETEFAAIGLVGVFYLMITSIGYSFSKAGQILIARRIGENDFQAVGDNTYSMWGFALTVALALFVLMFWLGETAFSLVVHSPEILQACSDYLYFRAPGIFFSYTGVVFIALYTGVSRTGIILYSSVALGLSNLALNYALIFGHWGLPEMGIGGAALASTLSEALAFVFFAGYILFFDRNNSRQYGLFRLPQIKWNLVKTQIRIATPIVIQSAVGMGSWFVFFLLIEGLGKHALAVSNLLRVVYLLLMIPTWGFASGLNTLVSKLIGQQRPQAVLPVINKTLKLCLAVTGLCALSLFIFPDQVFAIGTSSSEIIADAKELLPLFALVLLSFCVGALYFNGLIGTGATQQALYIQIYCVILYLIYVYAVLRWAGGDLPLAWAAEIVYWLAALACSLWHLHRGKWREVKV